MHQRRKQIQKPETGVRLQNVITQPFFHLSTPQTLQTVFNTSCISLSWLPTLSEENEPNAHGCWSDQLTRAFLENDICLLLSFQLLLLYILIIGKRRSGQEQINSGINQIKERRTMSWVVYSEINYGRQKKHKRKKFHYLNIEIICIAYKRYTL